MTHLADERDARLMMRMAVRYAAVAHHNDAARLFAQHVSTTMYVPTAYLHGKLSPWGRVHYAPMADLRDALALELL